MNRSARPLWTLRSAMADLPVPKNGAEAAPYNLPARFRRSAPRCPCI